MLRIWRGVGNSGMDSRIGDRVPAYHLIANFENQGVGQAQLLGGGDEDRKLGLNSGELLGTGGKIETDYGSLTPGFAKHLAGGGRQAAS
ncbi:MAG: hypothetical protein HC890_10590 [Chloroflexaceae bacterium]|nr:hypothetical protein [Chloroflexaceae bacterium]